jgi:hypothetical protein
MSKAEENVGLISHIYMTVTDIPLAIFEFPPEWAKRSQIPNIH